LEIYVNKQVGTTHNEGKEGKIKVVRYVYLQFILNDILNNLNSVSWSFSPIKQNHY